jgi:hypothetical protein
MRIARTSVPVLAALLGIASCTEPAGGSPGNSHVVTLDVPVMDTPCFDVPLADVDATTPGEQYECSVSDVINPGSANQRETVLPACNNVEMPASSTNKPCWSIQTDVMTCPQSPSLRLVVERAEAPDAATHVIASCVSEA